ncbi:NAD(P)H-binding protein [Dactylosporangium roseum]|uniref:NAD(P)H-binding protein n=1 Tax=Dactylosporangium roseum TaxID=47989 RepID=A0ABY5YY60_9ACTN|nr:NAD(P)H-binding protein [Dactylosporangium roseum]UWZ34690.1 NAD(P)H-binding protein [Dactylosporangium roseum]
MSTGGDRGRILLVGGTGQVGSLVAGKLRNHDAPVRVMARDVETAVERLGSHVEIVRGDLLEPPTLAAALHGVDIAFLTTSPQPSLAEQEANFIDAAEGAGLPRLVKLSAAGCRQSPHPPFGWHQASEDRIEKAGIPVTLVRPTPFASILLWEAAAIRAGRLNTMMGDALFSFIDPEDVADLVVAALTDPAHTHRAWEVGGPEALTYDEVATALTGVLGWPVEHGRVDETTFRAGLLGAGMPDWLGDVFAGTRRLAARNVFAVGDAVVREVLGRPARTLTSWIERHRDAFGTTG